MGSAAANWLQPLFAAVMNTALALAIGVVVLRPALRSAALSGASSDRLDNITRWACWLLGVSLLAYCCTGTIAMTDSSLSDLPASLWLVLTQSHFGKMLWLACAAWILLAIAVIATNIPARRELLILGLIGFSFARAATGHAADQGFFSFWVLIHTAHILAATTWVGSVIVCALLSADWKHWSLSQRSALAHRLSEIATWALLLVIGSGLFNVARTMGHASDIWASDYAWILLAKLCAVLIASGLGLRNRWYWLTQLDRNKNAGAAGFRRVLIAELIVLLVVLVLAAKLGTTMPAQ